MVHFWMIKLLFKCFQSLSEERPVAEDMNGVNTASNLALQFGHPRQLYMEMRWILSVKITGRNEIWRTFLKSPLLIPFLSRKKAIRTCGWFHRFLILSEKLSFEISLMHTSASNFGFKKGALHIHFHCSKD